MELSDISLADALITTDKRGRVSSVNPEAEKLLGYTQNEARGQPIWNLYRAHCNATHNDTQERVERCLRRESSVVIAGSLVLTLRNGEKVSISEILTPVYDDSHHISGAILALRKNESCRPKARVLSFTGQTAFHDASGRREFEHRLHLMLNHAQNFNQHHMVSYLELGDYSAIKKTCGAAGGSELLQQLSQKLRQCIRTRDTFTALEEGRFAIILGDCSPNQAHYVAAKWVELIQAFRFHWKRKVITINVNIGLAPITTKSGNTETIKTWALDALNAAKAEGRNTIAVYRPTVKLE